ncbi:MAG: mechanosensitive ion channel domain-containing protein [Pseudomonadota bacterium]
MPFRFQLQDAPVSDPVAPEPATPEPAAPIETLPEQVEGFVTRAITWGQSILEDLLSIHGALELGAIVLSGVLAFLLAGPFNRLLGRLWPADDMARSRRARDVVTNLMRPICWVAALWVSTAAIHSMGYAPNLTTIAASLLNAWILIRFVSSFVKDEALAKFFALIAWSVAALNIFGLLQPTIDALKSVGFDVGESRLSLFLALKGIVLAIVLIWIATATSAVVQSRLERTTRFTPSMRSLLSQGARLGLLFLAVMLSLNAIGVDLTALAVFSGAIGVGIGFGLQSIFSNLMAGIILLLERTIKVGDFVEFDNGLYGEVREINIRATLVTTNDNVDILVPNSEFINNRVTNWTLRDGYRRTRIPFGVAYGTDKELVKKAALEAAAEVPHILTGRHAREPEVWLMGFGDSSLDFELVVWLRAESVKRPSRVRADYNWALETALAKYGIEIPFPQRDINFRTGRIPVELTGNAETSE